MEVNGNQNKTFLTDPDSNHMHHRGKEWLAHSPSFCFPQKKESLVQSEGDQMTTNDVHFW